MPPQIVKKPKGREGRQSRSRNTTPSSAAEISTSSIIPANTSYTEIPIGSLQVPSNITYDDLLERHGGAGGIPDPSHLTTMAQHLKHLSELASARGDTCNQGMRVLSEKRKSLVLEEEREKELEREQALRARESEERRTLKREAEDDEDLKERKSGKQKKQRKERSAVRDPERPLNHGAHGLARQDGLDLPLEGELHTFLWSAVIYITCCVKLFDTFFVAELQSMCRASGYLYPWFLCLSMSRFPSCLRERASTPFSDVWPSTPRLLLWNRSHTRGIRSPERADRVGEESTN